MFGLRKTLSSLFNRSKVDEALFESLEESLLLADVGIAATTELLTQLRSIAKKEKISDALQLKTRLETLIAELLAPLEFNINPLNQHTPTHIPEIWLIVGVNGAGKTTTIGKLCHALQQQNKKVMLAAGDTFRAAAREQLGEWGRKNSVDVIVQNSGDAATVAHDAIGAAQARQADLLLIDTAGRLATQSNLMEELKKVKRVIQKLIPNAPHQTVLVLDGNTGQNGLSQVKAFHEALSLTSLIITKVDGTAKGGVLCAISQAFRLIPNHPRILGLGVGEQIQQLQPFTAQEFAKELLQNE
jgi:fused signal recognition particle receptor